MTKINRSKRSLPLNQNSDYVIIPVSWKETWKKWKMKFNELTLFNHICYRGWNPPIGLKSVCSKKCILTLQCLHWLNYNTLGNLKKWIKISNGRPMGYFCIVLKSCQNQHFSSVWAIFKTPLLSLGVLGEISLRSILEPFKVHVYKCSGHFRLRVGFHPHEKMIISRAGTDRMNAKYHWLDSSKLLK